MPHRHTLASVSALSDARLITQLQILVHEDRRLTARLLIHLAEVDARKLYLEHACSSMHVYCVERLHMSDPQAYRRIHAARTARKYPRVVEMIAGNQLHLSGVALLAPYLTETNHDEILDAAVHKTKRQLEVLVAERFPRPDIPTAVRRLPPPKIREELLGVLAPAAPTAPMPAFRTPGARTRAVIAPTAPQRFKVQFTASAALHDKLCAAQDLLRHRIPNGDIAEIFERGLDALLRDARRRRFGMANRPREQKSLSKRTRHIPNAVRREVVERDGGRCTFVDGDGNRCSSTSAIQFHHIDAYANGGEHTLENITLRCAAHNRHAAENELGREVVAAKVRDARKARAMRNFGAPPAKSAATPQSAATPPAKSAATPPAKSAATPPGKSAATPPEKSAATPPGKSLLAPHNIGEPRAGYAVTQRHTSGGERRGIAAGGATPTLRPGRAHQPPRKHQPTGKPQPRSRLRSATSRAHLTRPARSQERGFVGFARWHSAC